MWYENDKAIAQKTAFATAEPVKNVVLSETNWSEETQTIVIRII
jgi:hypothetical protein